MRLFLAINLSPQVRRAIHGATTPLREAAPRLAWVCEARLHLTLKFLGEQPEEMAGRVAGAMAEVGLRHWPIVARLGGIGAFPNLRRPTVVWMGVRREPRLELLHHDVESRCADLGFEVEGRPFRPHLTLARVKGPAIADTEALRALAGAARSVKFRDDIVVGSIDLMWSELSSGGPRYTPLASAPLRSA